MDIKYFVMNVYVWDNLENVEFISSKMFVRVNEIIYFFFVIYCILIFIILLFMVVIYE